MKKLKVLGRDLAKSEQKRIFGGLVDPGGGGTCCSTCWINVTTELGSVEVPDCSTSNAGKCKDTYPSATKATCSC